MACLPPPLMTSEPGSFARETIAGRKPRIIADAIADWRYPEGIVEALGIFAGEIEGGAVSPPPAGIPLYGDWLAEWQQWRGRTWLQVPWYFAEAYFYVRLLAAVGYYEGRSGDPFAKRKEALLGGCRYLMPSLAEAQRLAGASPPAEALALLLRRSLWGNRLDLSNIAIAERHGGDASHLDDASLLVDDCAAAYEAIATRQDRPVVLICDNSGPELLADLHLAAWLLDRHVDRVALALKEQPFFVSDAMPGDALASIDYLAGCDEPGVGDIGGRLRAAVDDGRLELRSHPFWTGPHHYNRLPPDLAAWLAQAALVVSKGDVNYRRFLQDRHWPFHTPIEQVVDYFPADVLLLRTFKGELAAGLPQAVVKEVSAAEPDWLVSGRHGVVQFVPRRGGAAP